MDIEVQARLEALRLAVTNGIGSPPEDIVKAAKTYSDFLLGVVPAAS